VEITLEYQDAVGRHQESIVRIGSLLQQYRDDTNLSRDGAPETELDTAAEQYERTSVEVAGLITEQLVVALNVPADQADGGTDVQVDDDAADRMTALIEVDAAILSYTTTITALRDPDGDGNALRTGALNEEELAALAPEGLAQSCAPAFAVLRDGIDAAPPPVAGAADIEPFKVKPYFDEILSRTSADILRTVASGIAWEAAIAHALLHRIADLGTRLPAPARHGWTALRRLLGRAWRQGLSKIATLVGPDAAQFGHYVANIVNGVVPDIEGWGIGRALRTVLQIDEPQKDAQELVDGMPGRVVQVREACDKVKAHHFDRRKPVRGFTIALGGCKFIPVAGLQVQIVATALLLIYEVWLAHDYLDSPMLPNLRLPRNSGLLTAVQGAVA
jgi:hypothetical protein